jgi:hypothetical protein
VGVCVNSLVILLLELRVQEQCEDLTISNSATNSNSESRRLIAQQPVVGSTPDFDTKFFHCKAPPMNISIILRAELKATEQIRVIPNMVIIQTQLRLCSLPSYLNCISTTTSHPSTKICGYGCLCALHMPSFFQNFSCTESECRDKIVGTI